MPTDQEILEKEASGAELTPEEQQQIMGETDSVNVDESEQDDDFESWAKEDEEEEGQGKETEEGAEESAEEESETDTGEEKPDDADTSEANEEKGEEVEAEEEAADSLEEKAEDQSSGDKIREQLDKPEGEEDLSDFTERERGLYREMRYERRKRQDIERERNQLKFKEMKRELENEEEEPDSEDFLNKQQVQDEVGRHVVAIETKYRKQMTKLWEREGKRLYDDFDQVLDVAKTLVDGNEKYQEMIRDAYEEGDNVALVIYDIAKSDPNFAAVAAAKGFAPSSESGDRSENSDQKGDKKADPAALKNAKKIQENSKKTQTTGQKGGGDAGGGKEYLSQEFVRNLSDEDFAKLPPKQQEEILAKYG